MAVMKVAMILTREEKKMAPEEELKVVSFLQLLIERAAENIEGRYQKLSIASTMALLPTNICMRMM